MGKMDDAIETARQQALKDMQDREEARAEEAEVLSREYKEFSRAMAAAVSSLTAARLEKIPFYTRELRPMHSKNTPVSLKRRAKVFTHVWLLGKPGGRYETLAISEQGAAYFVAFDDSGKCFPDGTIDWANPGAPLPPTFEENSPNGSSRRNTAFMVADGVGKALALGIDAKRPIAYG